jgi:hypothetical protein
MLSLWDEYILPIEALNKLALVVETSGLNYLAPLGAEARPDNPKCVRKAPVCWTRLAQSKHWAAVANAKGKALEDFEAHHLL